jgi:hypothetical protein
MLGLRVLHSDLSVTTRYFHTDNLGSIAVATFGTFQLEATAARGTAMAMEAAVIPTARGLANEAQLLTEMGLTKTLTKVYTGEGAAVPDAISGISAVRSRIRLK